MELLRFGLMLSLGLIGICLILLPILDSRVPDSPPAPSTPDDAADWRPA